MRSNILSAVAAFLCFLMAESGGAHATTIWFAADDPYSSAQFAPGSSADFMQMFSSGATWQDAVPGLTTIKVYQAFVANATNGQLESMISWANANDISISVEGGVLPVAQPADCGWGVEGYNDAFVSQIQRLSSLGATVSDVAMDEPLYFGSLASGGNTCGNSIATTAALVAQTYQKLLNIYPNLELTDIEPIPYVMSEYYDEWLQDLAVDLPKKLSSFQADVVWSQPYQADLGAIDDALTSDGISTSVIIDGASSASSNLTWEASALSHAEAIESNPATCVDTLIVQTWEPFPTEVLSPDTPGSLSNLAEQLSTSYQGNPCAGGQDPAPPTAVLSGAPALVPEPTSGSLLALPIIALAAILRYRRRTAIPRFFRFQ